MLDLSKVVMKPGISLVAKTVIDTAGLEDAVEQLGLEDVAERSGTPLNELMGRVHATDESTGGNGDDLPEFAGRQCYNSFAKGRSNEEYIENVLNEAHGSIFEHVQMSYQVTGVSRTLTHELVRHSIGCGYSQESQRYVDAKDIRFVAPPLLVDNIQGMSPADLANDTELNIFRRSCGQSLADYQELQAAFMVRLNAMKAGGASEKDKTAAKKRANEAARSLLHNAAETKMIFSTNLRAIRHILTLRGTEFADLEIRRFAVLLLEKSRGYAPNFFQAVNDDIGGDGRPMITASVGRV